MGKTVYITFYSNSDNKLFSLYKIRKYFKKILNAKGDYYSYTSDGNITFTFNKYSSLHICNTDNCECMSDIIDIINKVNSYHKITVFTDSTVTKEFFELLDSKLQTSLYIKGYRKHR